MCRLWTVLQVVAIVICYRGKVFSERAQGCVWSQLSLRCPEMNVIQITSIVLGDSSCTGSSCCIKDSDCTRDANANHKAEVQRRCNNRQSCTVGVLREKITCGVWGAWSNNDFERITYTCINDPQRSTTATFSRLQSTRVTVRTEENTSKKETEKGLTTATFSTSSRSASTEGAEETRPKMETENGSTSATFSTSDSIENILQTEETTPEKETKYDGIAGSTTATSSRSGSTGDILLKEEKSPEKKTKTGINATEINIDTASSADRDKNKKGSYDKFIGHDENGSPEDRSDNPWIIPVVMATVCLLVLVAIVVLVVVMRRKNRLKGIVAAEMTYLGSYGSEAINGNEIQTISLNNGNGSPIHINDMIKESNYTDPEVPENSEVPNNTVYNSVACYAGSKPTADTISLEGKEPAYQTPRPRSDVYTVARDIGEPACSGSTKNASKQDNDVHSDVNSREPANATNSSDVVEINHGQSRDSK